MFGHRVKAKDIIFILIILILLLGLVIMGISYTQKLFIISNHEALIDELRTKNEMLLTTDTSQQTISELRQELDTLKKALNNTEKGVASVIEERAKEVLTVIKNQEYGKLAEYIHPEKGVRFSPSAAVNLHSDLVLSGEQIKKSATDQNKYIWGTKEESGEQIELSIVEYFSNFVYDYDFLSTNRIEYNRSLNEQYPTALLVEYYSESGAKGKSLHLVFEQKAGQWYLVGIIHC